MMSKTKILIVEDEWIIAENTQRVLEDYNYEVIGLAASYEETLEMARKNPPDLVLMDIILKGGKDGLETAAALNQDLNLPIIFITAYSNNSLIQKAKAIHSFGYIIKPFVGKELHSAIEMGLYRHEMENQLREREAWLAATLNSIDDAVITTDMNCGVISMNPVAARLTGWISDDAIGKQLIEVFIITHSISGAPFPNPVKQVLNDGIRVTQGHDITLLSRDGVKYQITLSVSPIVDINGTVLGGVLVFHDETHEYRMQEKIRLERDRAKQYLDIAGVMMVALDTQNRVTMVNRKGCEILGFPEEEILGKPWFDHFIHPRIREDVKAEFKLILEGKVEQNEEYLNPVLSRSGAERMISWHNTIVKDQAGNIVGTLSSGEDITDRNPAKRTQRESEPGFE